MFWHHPLSRCPIIGADSIYGNGFVKQTIAGFLMMAKDPDLDAAIEIANRILRTGDPSFPMDANLIKLAEQFLLRTSQCAFTAAPLTNSEIRHGS